MATSKKTSTEVKDTAKYFINGLIANMSHHHLDAATIQQVVEKAHELAEAFHNYG